MATETNLTKINVFPSESSYNTNKNSLGSGELALIPFARAVNEEETSITSNGYITFDNGLIIQWGKTSAIDPLQVSNANREVTFPIPFKEACYSIACCFSENVTLTTGAMGMTYLQLTHLSNTKFSYYSNTYYSEPRYWIAIGK